VRDACRDEGYRTWVAEAPAAPEAPAGPAGDGDRPVGFAVVAVHDNPRCGEIYMIAVDPDYQNQGTGLDLVTFAVDRITEQGLPLAQIGTGGDPRSRPGPPRLEEGRLHPGPVLQGTAWRSATGLGGLGQRGRVPAADGRCASVVESLPLVRSAQVGGWCRQSSAGFWLSAG